jgi:site-specific DNA-cytosine methylase
MPGHRQRKATVSSNVGGTIKPQEGKQNNGKGRYKLADALRLQGLPLDWLDHCPFTADGKLKAVANGVAIPTGRAIAKAIKCALEELE